MNARFQIEVDGQPREAESDLVMTVACIP